MDTLWPKFWPPTPKTYLAITCNIWLRLGQRPLDSACFFRPATLIFLTPGPIFGAPGQGLGPRRPEGPFGAQKGDPKNMILWRDWTPTRFPGIFCEGNGFYGTQEPFGCTNFPPNPPRERFYTDFPQTQKFQGAPWAPGWVAYCPFVGHWPIAGVGGMAASPLYYKRRCR